MLQRPHPMVPPSWVFLCSGYVVARAPRQRPASASTRLSIVPRAEGDSDVADDPVLAALNDLKAQVSGLLPLKARMAEKNPSQQARILSQLNTEFICPCLLGGGGNLPIRVALHLQLNSECMDVLKRKVCIINLNWNHIRRYS